ncbi:S8 family serine peptidase [Ruficoccus sp. ZRK36]|uniref:S8 family peptidase n=1 Tax=Ruficoccus sp. ZRK36 TaxID=2866311 RepID=UPI001C73D818|nr:S8 family serine peptidase [Ruficoccus sp. ZRK36]QYY35446.1 S8 family serine peptidase [Ruficoccus sp. ZRK36]
MMKKALTLILTVALLGLSAWLAWSLGRASHSREAGEPAAQSFLSESPSPPPSETKAAPISSEPFSLNYPEAPAGSLRGEATLVFDSQDEYEQALAWLRAQGVDVRDLLPGLNAIRIGTYDPIWKRLGAAPDQVGYNFPITPPPPVADSPYLSAHNAAFGAGVLEFLGVDEVDASWGEGVIVAVLDSGVETDHADLKDAHLLTLTREGRSDPVGHGTAVASLIAGQESPVPGLTPGATILSLPVLDDKGRSDTFRVAEAILLAVDQGARVISMSLGAYGDSRVLREAVKYAAAHDVIMVASVGNDGAGQVAYPAAYDDVVAVAAVDALGQPASFSNYGPQVDIAAPGVGVPVAWNGNRYASVSGTSFSAPLVASAIALVLQQEPGMSAHEAIGTVLDNANEGATPGKDEFVGQGILNIERILERNQRGIFDAATAGFSVSTAEGTPSGLIEVMVENRGTEYLREVWLTIEYSDHEESIALGALGPGDVYVQPVQITPDPLNASDLTEVHATVGINGSDSRPGNDSFTGQVQTRPTSEAVTPER